MKSYELIREIERRGISVTAMPDGRLKVEPLAAARDLLDAMREHRIALDMLARGKVERYFGAAPVFPSCRAMLETGEYRSDDPQVRACFMCEKGDPVTIMLGGRPALTGLCSKKSGRPNDILQFDLAGGRPAR
jgi:hypothetical protein